MSGPKRTYGTGALAEKHGNWYGRWRTLDGRRLHRRVGPVRAPGTSGGLTRREAEAELRRMILDEERLPTPPSSVARQTVDDAALALIEFKRVQGVSKSYLATLGTARRLHFGPVLGTMPLRKVHRRLGWASGLDVQRVWAIEDSRHVSCRLERALLAHGEHVVRVAPKMMSNERTTARTPGKSDSIDALAIARVAVREPDLPLATIAGQERAICPVGRPSRRLRHRSQAPLKPPALAAARP
jgi:hypothetical protein